MAQTFLPARVLVFLTIFTSILPSRAMAEEFLARAGISIAQTKAAEWQQDAILVSISTLQANLEGKSLSWSYTFFAPSIDKGLSVTVSEDQISESLEVGAYLKTQVDSRFIDSDKALKLAVDYGLTAKKNIPMTLIVMGQATDKVGTHWTIGSGYSSGETSVILNALDGRLVSTPKVTDVSQ
ncbi:MAG: hypothetical protein KDD42_04320 [Bdellovibrionales bacterium]|nr:hypothetical protein [Bdellovibrionales bacterium]